MESHKFLKSILYSFGLDVLFCGVVLSLCGGFVIT